MGGIVDGYEKWFVDHENPELVDKTVISKVVDETGNALKRSFEGYDEWELGNVQYDNTGWPEDLSEKDNS